MEEYLIYVVREGLYLVLLMVGPAILASFVVTVVSGALQTATQVQDASLGAIPRLVAVCLALMIAGPWIGEQLLRFARVLFEGIPGLAH